VPGLGRVRIITVERLPSLAALTRADALADGFTTRREMLAEIRRLYAGATGRAVYRVRFVWKSGPQPRHAQRAQPLETRNSTRETRKSRRRQLARFIQSLPPPPPRAAAPRP
jgi:hypothetical protein